MGQPSIEKQAENALIIKQKTNKTNYSKSTANFVEEERKTGNDNSSLKTSSSLEEEEEWKVGRAQQIRFNIAKYRESNGSKCFTVKEDTNEPNESFNSPNTGKALGFNHL